jgi:small subunit ribosomal protein S9
MPKIKEIPAEKPSKTHDKIGTTAKKEKKPVTAKVVEERKSVKASVVEMSPNLSSVKTDADGGEMGDDDISKEIAATIKNSAGKSDRYIESTGRRKTAVARVRLFTRGDKEFLVNDKSYQEYFQTAEDRETSISSMKKMKCLDKFRVTVKVKGGGHTAQAEAVRHGTARVLVEFNANFRKRLRKAGFLTRDSRMRERKKFGLNRARRAPQWSKR